MKLLKKLTLGIALGIAATNAAIAGPLDDVSGYFNGLETLETSFVQHNSDGSTSSGTLFLKRPGRLRMEYDANGNGALMVVGGGSVAIFDKKSDQDATRYPLRRTPLGPILARKVDLKHAGMIDVAHEYPDRIHVFASDAKHPEYGVGQFSFDKDPIRLTAWTMTNEFGEETRIEFSENAKTGHDLSSRLFSIHQEENNRNPRQR
jgi:outer membrane lipoprotein-sorting protein